MEWLTNFGCTGEFRGDIKKKVFETLKNIEYNTPIKWFQNNAIGILVKGSDPKTIKIFIFPWSEVEPKHGS